MTWGVGVICLCPVEGIGLQAEGALGLWIPGLSLAYD